MPPDHDDPVIEPVQVEPTVIVTTTQVSPKITGILTPPFSQARSALPIRAQSEPGPLTPDVHTPHHMWIVIAVYVVSAAALGLAVYFRFLH